MDAGRVHHHKVDQFTKPQQIERSQDKCDLPLLCRNARHAKPLQISRVSARPPTIQILASGDGMKRNLPAVIVVEPRFNGFPDIALGGYVGGILAHGRAKAEVTLRRPVRLGKPYQTVEGSGGVRILKDGENVIAEAREASVDLEVPLSVGVELSRSASKRYLGHRKHLIPSCFNCGPSRPEGDGLRIFPGIVAERGVVAAPWVPSSTLAGASGEVSPEFIWSALDCPTIWALVLLGKPDTDEKAVTGRLAVDLTSPAIAGEPHVVMAWREGESGRTRVAGGAIYSANGRLVAKAKHTLVTTDWGVPMGLNHWQ